MTNAAAPRAYAVLDAPFPGEAPRPPANPRDPARNCYIVLGNHQSYSGIVEMVHALHATFSRHYPTYVSQWLVPGAINVVIDEFAKPAMVDLMRQVRQSHPQTRIVVMATEFITQMAPLGIPLGNTFNYFGAADGSKDLLRHALYRSGVRKIKPYFEARYAGFVDALPLMDLVLCAHQAVADTMALLPASARGAMRPPLTLNPEIDPARVAADPRLYTRDVGVVMTGTLSKYRASIARDLLKAFKLANIDRPIYQHLPFNNSDGMVFSPERVDLGHTRDLQQGADTPQALLYNLNPPQRQRWAYSSPMRIQRAILLGQIPLITRRFNDHPIEDVAGLWDGTPEAAQKLWIEGMAGRDRLIDRHLQAVARYSEAALRQNAPIDAALAEIG